MGKGVLLSVLIFFGGLWCLVQYGIPFAANVKGPDWLPVFIMFFLLYVGAQFLAAAIDLLQGRYKATIKNFWILWRSYLFITLVHLFMWVLAVPLFLFLFIVGPVAFIGGGIAVGILLIYLLQAILGLDVVTHPPGGLEALLALLFLSICALLLWGLSRLFKHNYDPIERFADFYYRRILQPAERYNIDLLDKLDRIKE